MTDMSEGPNVSNERQHAEAVAREWISHNGLDAHSTSDQKHRDISSLADIIMAERTGLLARAEAAEANVEALRSRTECGGRDVDLTDPNDACQSARVQAGRAEAAEGDAQSWRLRHKDACGELADLRAKLAAAEARIKKSVECDWQVEAARLFEERGEERARAAKAEAAAGQMRSALDLYLSSQDDETWRHHGCPSTPSIIAASRAALATDAGRGYLSPEQVAQACAAARDTALRFAIAEVEALLKVKRAVGCYSPAFLAAFDDVLVMLRADLERGGRAATSELQGRHAMIDKPDWRNRRCGDGWQSDGGDCRLPLGHTGAHESDKPDWVAEALALCNAATPGEWQLGVAGNADVVYFDGDDIHGVAHVYCDADRALVVAARTALPRALTALEAADALASAASALVTCSIGDDDQALAVVVKDALATYREARR